jgi:hypothetical protein
MLAPCALQMLVSGPLWLGSASWLLLVGLSISRPFEGSFGDGNCAAVPLSLIWFVTLLGVTERLVTFDLQQLSRTV